MRGPSSGKARTVLLASTLLWVCVLLVIGTQLHTAQREDDALAQERFSLRTESTAAAVGSYVETQAQQAQRLGTNLLGAKVDAARFDDVMHAAGYAAAVLLDARGRALAVSPSKPALLGVDLAATYAHLAAARDGRVGVSDVVLSAAEHLPIAAVAVSFPGRTGRRVLSVANRIQDTPLRSFITSGSGFNAASALRDGAGHTIVGVGDASLVQAAAPTTAPATGQGLVAGPDERRIAGRSYLVSQQLVPGTPWTLTQVVAKDVLLAPTKGRGKALPWILLLALGAAGLFALVLLRRSLRAGDRLRAQEQDLVAARDAAVASAAARAAFLAAASHEIRTPLNGVIGMLELVDSARLPEDEARRLRVAQRSAETLLATLNELLDLAKADVVGRGEVGHTPFDLTELLDDVLAVVTGAAERKGLSVVFSGHRDLPRLVGDRGKLRQILVNLLGNAVKFTDVGPVSVQVAAQPTTDRLHLAFDIVDSGPGMSAQEIDTLFQPYVQGAAGRRYGGSGLGLVLTRELVELLGGSLTVHSEPGCGSTFRVELPLNVAALQPRQPAAAVVACEPQPLRGLRVLVVDDNEVNLLVAAELLSLLGAETEEARHGAEGVELASLTHFDLILMDCWMPVLDGPAATQRIRALDGPLGDVPIVAVTAAAGAEERDMCLAAGMNAVLTKPLRLTELERVLREVLAATGHRADQAPAPLAAQP